MANHPENNLDFTRNGGHVNPQNRTRPPRPGACLIIAAMVIAIVPPVIAAEEKVPEFTVITVNPDKQGANDLLPGWEQPRKPSQLTGKERQELIEAVSGAESGGIPLLNNIQTQGRTPTVRQLILSVKRPWYVHRAFLSSEGAQRVDARSVIHFDANKPARAVVGLNLIEGNTYLLDFLIDGQGAGVYSIETDSGIEEFPDPDGTRNHVLVALRAEQSGWTELSLRRSAGSFDLHSVEVTLALGTGESTQEPAR